LNLQGFEYIRKIEKQIEGQWAESVAAQLHSVRLAHGLAQLGPGLRSMRAAHGLAQLRSGLPGLVAQRCTRLLRERVRRRRYVGSLTAR
jgi:hypothetical protein